MAKRVLAIPEMRYLSEGVCRKKEKLASQCALLSCLSVEVLLCLKDWSRALGPMYVAQPDPLVVLCK